MRKNLARLYSAELDGIDARLIEIEADINVGLHAFNIVGLADKSLNEAKERVNSALKNSGVKPPNRENRKITINLAPADIQKNGARYDLGIALSYLLATNQIKKFFTCDKIFLGELALDGRLRPVNGILSAAERAARSGFSYIFVPKQNANEASAISKIKAIGIETLSQAVQMLEGERSFVVEEYCEENLEREKLLGFSEVYGQENAKRALTVAAAGGHHALLIGPPGVGKSMLAHATAGILPPLSKEESIEVTKIWSAAGLSANRLLRTRPFRAPHHTTPAIALVGGGQDPRPGEISMAHRGILFLDEFPEFPRESLEALREPLESGMMRIARARHRVILPARFTLIAAMNPCPCGYRGNAASECKCSPYEIIRYQRKISGPLLDRMDIRIAIGKTDADITVKKLAAEKDADALIKEKICSARERQYRRFGRMRLNTEMSSREAIENARLNHETQLFLEAAGKRCSSPRSFYRAIKVARTIADLDDRATVSVEDAAEAFGYRINET